MVYTALYMAATRTQVYLTEAQRKRLDELRRREHKSLAQLIREAVDAFLANARPDPAKALEESFGAFPQLEVPPREEWEERERRLGI